MTKKKILIISFVIVIAIVFTGALVFWGINSYVKSLGGNNIISVSTAMKLENVDCILVLGCGVNPNGKPSWMLEDRLKKGIELYQQGVAPKIIMSGDHGSEYYDEVNTMKQYAVDAGVPSSDIFMDHAGFSTYESMYRAKEIFQVDSMVIVSQEYHLYRAIYIARKLDMTAFGVSTDEQIYGGELYREAREKLARVKDFFTVLLKPEPTYLGEAVPVNSDGNTTNDSLSFELSGI